MRKSLAIALAAWCALLPRLALATQSELVPPASGIYTGVQFSQFLGDAARSAASCNKGSVAPANVAGVAVDGLCWIDDSVSPWIVKRFVNGDWATEGYLDPSASAHVGVLGGGAPATLSAGSTVDLGSVPQANVLISGAASISSLGGSALPGVIKVIRFDDAATLVHSSSLKVPGGFPLTTASGDRAVVTSFGSGNWEVTTFTRDSGIAIDVAAVGRYEYNTAAATAGLHVPAMGQALARASYPAYLAKVTRAQNGTRTSGNATITSVANTDGFGAGMPVEGTGIADGCTIASVVANTSITLNSSSCVTSGTATVGTVTVFLTGYGRAGDKTTVGVPECRTRTLAGRDRNDPGSYAGFLTSGVFGANPSIFGVTGSSSESVAMVLANLISHQHAVFLKDPSHNHTKDVFGSATSGSVPFNGGGSPTNHLTTDNAFTGMTIGSVNGVANDNQTAAAGSGSPTPMRTVPPMITAACDMRVIP